MPTFASRLLRWHAQHGRHDLPWSGTRDPYRVWLSEIMLQQTQVATAMPYYHRFIQRFGNVQALATATQTEVLQAWAGLGYYARARNLHACAQRIVKHHSGVFPQTAHELAQLPGIGRSTAAAIAAFCFDAHAAILDGNVKRVLARCFGVEGFPGTRAVEHQLWALAQSLLPTVPKQMSLYTQALMDLGATVCTRRAPRCQTCPLRTECIARRQGRVDTLPTPRPTRSVAQRRVFWLILIARGRVWLQRQPQRGLWGGLLAPPQFASRPALRRWLMQRGLDLTLTGQTLPERRHDFTHLKLHFVPYVLRLKPSAPSGALEADPPNEGQWLPLNKAAQSEVPTPVRALLGEL